MCERADHRAVTCSGNDPPRTGQALACQPAWERVDGDGHAKGEERDKSLSGGRAESYGDECLSETDSRREEQVDDGRRGNIFCQEGLLVFPRPTALF